MANIDYKEGQYSIAGSATTQFTFWWGRDSKAPHEFFDVSISPEFDKAHERPLPLVEEKREVVLDLSEGPGRVVLLLTLRNQNAFAIKFMANHVRIYS